MNNAVQGNIITRLLRERRHELIKRDERLQISSKTGRVPVKIDNKKRWALNGRLNKRLIAVRSPRTTKLLKNILYRAMQ